MPPRQIPTQTQDENYWLDLLSNLSPEELDSLLASLETSGSVASPGSKVDAGALSTGAGITEDDLLAALGDDPQQAELDNLLGIIGLLQAEEPQAPQRESLNAPDDLVNLILQAYGPGARKMYSPGGGEFTPSAGGGDSLYLTPDMREKGFGEESRGSYQGRQRASADQILQMLNPVRAAPQRSSLEERAARARNILAILRSEASGSTSPAMKDSARNLLNPATRNQATRTTGPSFRSPREIATQLPAPGQGNFNNFSNEDLLSLVGNGLGAGLEPFRSLLQPSLPGRPY